MGASEASGKRGEHTAEAARSAARLRTIEGAKDDATRTLDAAIWTRRWRRKLGTDRPNRRAEDGSPQSPSDHKDVCAEQEELWRPKQRNNFTSSRNT